MAAITLKQPATYQAAQSILGGSNGFRLQRGVGAFNSTDASGTLAVPGFTKVQHVQLVLLDTPKVITENIQLPLGTLSADHKFSFRFPHAGTVTAASLVTKEALAVDGTNYYTFSIVNLGAAGVGTAKVVDPATVTNSTFTGGTAQAAYTPRAFTLGAAADLIVVAGDVGQFFADETGAAASFTEASLSVSVNIGGTDETLFVNANSDGSIPITSGAITIARTGNVKTSGAKFAFTVTGY